jgi:co-chaperonin GroES (HSP10)
VRILGNKIGVTVLRTPSKVGRFYMPDEARRLTQEAIVRYVGDGVKESTGLKPGDRVLYDPYERSTRIKDGDKEILVLQVNELLGKIEK